MADFVDAALLLICLEWTLDVHVEQCVVEQDLLQKYLVL